MAEVIYPDVNSLWDALTADWGVAGSYGLLIEGLTAASTAAITTALGAEFDGTPDLYDTLIDGGIPVWPAAADPANNISMAQVLRQVFDDVTATLDRVQYQVVKEAWFSAPDDIISLTQAASDDALPGVVLPILAGRIIDRVHVGFAIGFIENTNAGANALTGAVDLMVMRDDGAWDTDDVIGVSLPDNSLMTAGDEKRAGVVFIGETDVSGEVDVFNDTYLMRLDACTVDNDFLNLYDVQTFLVVVYH